MGHLGTIAFEYNVETYVHGGKQAETSTSLRSSLNAAYFYKILGVLLRYNV